jgi:mevalonate kinase
VLYHRDEEPLPIEMAPISAVVLNTGVAGDTAQLVAGVNARRPGNEHLLQRLGQLVEERAPHLDDTAALGEAMNEAHGLLTELGVSTTLLDELVVLARRHGALGAKLSGAGGGGIVLALVDDPTSLLRAAKRRGLRALPLTLPSSEPA